MEWSWRTVLILIALVVIGYIVFDGIRRMRRAQAEALRLDVSNDFRFPADDRNPELPGGGFRVVGKQQAPAAEQKEMVEPVFADSGESEMVSKARPAVKTPVVLDPLPDLDASDGDDSDADELHIPDYSQASAVAEQRKPVVDWDDDVGPVRVISAEKAEEKRHEPVTERVQDLVIPQSPLIPKARPVNLDEAVPVLLDVEELGSDDVEPVFGSVDDFVADAGFEDEPVIIASGKTAGAEKPAQAEKTSVAPDEPVAEAEEQDPHLDQEVDDIPADLVSQPVNFAAANAESLAARPIPELVLEIHCIAHDPQGFSGKDILFLFNSCDLRFGEKKIFHRFEEPDGAGCIQFSVSQSYEPGIFVPAAMAQQHFRGLSFFMSLPGAKRPMEAYEAMSEMALVIARKLKADLYDGARSALTPQTMAHDRQQIMDYERRQKVAQKKQARR